MEQSRLLDWSKDTCVIAASGPSLSDEQVALVQHASVKSIAVNSTAFKMSWATVFYACDFMWFKQYRDRLPKFKAKCWTQDRTSAERFGLNYVRQSARPGLGLKTVQVNGNSGFGAINLAFLFGCRRMILIGFDFKLGPKGERHWHADHPPTMVQKAQFGEWLFKSTVLAADLKAQGVGVTNCTPGSALKVWPFEALSVELAKC